MNDTDMSDSQSRVADGLSDFTVRALTAACGTAPHAPAKLHLVMVAVSACIQVVCRLTSKTDANNEDCINAYTMEFAKRLIAESISPTPDGVSVKAGPDILYRALESTNFKADDYLNRDLVEAAREYGSSPEAIAEIERNRTLKTYGRQTSKFIH